jgi:hypothetical protein
VDFCIDKAFFGTPFYLKCLEDGTVKKTSEKPKDLLCVGDMETWFVSKLYGFKIPRFPSYKYRRFFARVLDKNAFIPWEHVMPSEAYKREIRETLTILQAAFKNLDLSYYEKYFKPQNEIFSDLRPAKINVERFLTLLSTGNDNNLKTFVPTAGFAQVPKYSRISTRTGRLGIKKGPMIQGIKREHRNVLESRFSGGSVWSLDFSSLEPRILLAIRGAENLPKDIYQNVIDTSGLHGVSRKAIKQAVLSRLYGGSDNTITEQLKNLVDYPQDILALVDDYFGIEELKQKLSLEFSINDGESINNFYGRRISCEGTPLYVLLNYYIQSTGVDVALMGFNNITKRIKQAGIQEEVVPLYLLHDALFLDVHPKYEYLLPKICKAGSLDIPGFENINFHLEQAKVV